MSEDIRTVEVIEPIPVIEPTEGVSFYDGEFFGDVIMAVELACGERISFSVENIPEDRRHWLGASIQSQVNSIIEKRVHEGIEAHKEAQRELFAASPLPE